MFNIRARKRIVGSLLAVGALTIGTAIAPVSTPAAQAAVPCPTGGSPAADIDFFVQFFNQNAVSMCVGYRNGNPLVKVQIVNLDGGAYISMDSGGSGSGEEPPTTFNAFGKLTMSDYAANWDVVHGPIQKDFAFSVTNASFFNNTDDGYTTLSFPWTSRSMGIYETRGTAISGDDPNSSTAKRVLKFTLTRGLQIEPFPAFYSEADAECSPGLSGCLVGLAPTVDPSGDQDALDHRTYVGVDTPPNVDAHRAFVLNGLLTVNEAFSILQTFGAVDAVQLDGGGSTRMVSKVGDWDNIINRAVPNVLVVRLGRPGE